MSRHVVLEVDHTPDTDYHMWIFLPGFRGVPVTVRRDSLGRRHKSAWRNWVVMICNNSECRGRALVYDRVLTDAAEAALPVPKVASA